MKKIAKSRNPDAWTKSIRCSKKHRQFVNLLAEECQLCREAATRPAVEGWGCTSEEITDWEDVKETDSTSCTSEEFTAEDILHDSMPFDEIS